MCWSMTTDGTPDDTTDDQLFIANTAFGIQKTTLANLMGAAADGVLAIDGAQAWTLKYAGENPWGGPLSLKMHGGKLYAALGFLGIGIYDPATWRARVPTTCMPTAPTTRRKTGLATRTASLPATPRCWPGIADVPRCRRHAHVTSRPLPSWVTRTT